MAASPAAIAYDRRRRQAIAAGQWQPKRDIAEVAAHVDRLVAAKMSQPQIARAAGVDLKTVSNVVNRRVRAVQAANANGLLAVPVPTKVTRVPRNMVPSIGTARRLQALSAIGYTISAIAAECGRTRGALANLSAPRSEWITRANANLIEEVYRRLSHTPAPDNTHARGIRTVARRNGWYPPEAWDDELGEIDDPAAVPYLGVPVEADYVDPVRLELVATGKAKLSLLDEHERIALVRELCDAGWSASRIARTASASTDKIRTLLRRAAADTEAAA